MGVAFGQQPQMRGHGLQAVDGHRAVHQPGGVHLDRLGLEGAEMLVEPGPPEQVDAVAGLQHRLLLARAAAAHQAEMAAMRARHHLEDGAGFAMLAGAENDSLVAPFHAGAFHRLDGEIKIGPGRAQGMLPMANIGNRSESARDF